MTHVDERSYAQLLDGSLDPVEARAIRRHLLEPCAACEAVIGNAPVDGLDARVDAALAAFAPVRAHEAGNDVEWQRIVRKTRAAKAPRGHVRQALAIAAVLTAVAGASIAFHSVRDAGATWDGVKAAAPARPWARLRFAVVRAGDGGSRIAKGVTGERVAARDRLQFQVDLGRAAEVALVRVGEGESPELLFLDRLGAGTTTLSMGTAPAAVALDGLSGRQRFAVVAGPPPLDPTRAAAAGAASAGGADAPEGLAIDAVEVFVR